MSQYDSKPALSSTKSILPPNLSQIFDSRPKMIQIITQNDLLGCCQVITFCRLQGFDLFFSHVEEERQIRGISPETNWHK